MEKATSHNTLTNGGNSIRALSGRDIAISPRINNLFNIPIDFSELLDEIAIGVVVLSLERKIVVMNQSLKALTGFSQKEFCGFDCAHILRSNICLHDCPVLRIDEKSGSRCIEGNLINKERQLIPIRITSAPLKNIDGKIIGFLETVEDIRLLRKLDETSSHA